MTIRVSDVEVEVVRKDIRNAHLAVYPPNGRVRLAAPLAMSDEAIRLMAISKLAWIRKHRRSILAQPRETPREYVNGESHYYLGQRYLLRVEEHYGRQFLELRGKERMVLHVHPGAPVASRARVFREWYRERVKQLAAPLLAKWQETIGVEPATWGVKVMRTKWGSCNHRRGTIWLNLELARKPHECLEYIIVHELVHLLEHTHNDRFVAYMDHFMPQWRSHREVLNQLPVRHEEWGY